MPFQSGWAGQIQKFGPPLSIRHSRKPHTHTISGIKLLIDGGLLLPPRGRPCVPIWALHVVEAQLVRARFFFRWPLFICLPTHTHAHTRKHTHKLAMFQHANSSINDIICVTNKNEIERKKVDCSKAENNKSTRYEENKNQI
uniref:(northern house mosquito) hypothetical protein n=1 Tax=Culex pipiens TaxID=7175 RepID=A0A8D8AIQ4_CULPI